MDVADSDDEIQFLGEVNKSGSKKPRVKTLVQLAAAACKFPEQSEGKFVKRKLQLISISY